MTHVNAYKAELEQAITKAHGALDEVATKFQAVVDKYEETPVEQPNTHAQGMADSPLVDTTIMNQNLPPNDPKKVGTPSSAEPTVSDSQQSNAKSSEATPVATSTPNSTNGSKPN